MKTSDFHYHLPKEFIAQQPVSPRDSSRLLIYNRKAKTIVHSEFRHITDYLLPDDLLVINQTRVIQARLFGKKVLTGGKLELLLLRRENDQDWQAMVGGKGLKPGVRFKLNKGPDGVILKDLGGPQRLIRFSETIDDYIENSGNVPLPPYITKTLDQPEKYQTIYAEDSGSAAAPTAGLHFTPELITNIQNLGIQIVKVTLHIGLDTFAPVQEENPKDHIIHSEWCHIPLKTAEAINQTKRKGGRVIAVGTTAVRTIETAARVSLDENTVKPFEGETDLFILPGFKFQVVDCLITNFHLPESTLIMMVSAFAGRKTILDLYQLAMEQGYRFYSFGDAMLII